MIILRSKWFIFCLDEYLSIESPEQSEDFNSTELNFGEDSPVKVNEKKETKVESVAAIVNHGMIVTAKTNNVERVIIPDKESQCCSCAILWYCTLHFLFYQLVDKIIEVN